MPKLYVDRLREGNYVLSLEGQEVLMTPTGDFMGAKVAAQMAGFALSDIKDIIIMLTGYVAEQEEAKETVRA